MFKEFLEKVAKYQQVGVYSHIRPDGDCIGSQIALCRWLEKKGIRCRAFNDDHIPENLQWLAIENSVTLEVPTATDLSECDLFILLDGNAIHRFGFFETWLKDQVKSPPLFMIDHHPDPDSVFDLMISVPEASSTCELIYNVYMEDDPSQIDVGVAKALYTGIITDTGSLQFDSVTPETVEITADLLRRGDFKPNTVIERIYSNRSLAQLKLLSKALESVALFENNQIALIYVTHDMLKGTGAGFDDCEGFVNYPLEIAGVKAAVFMKDHGEDGIRMSLRSRSDVDVNQWARAFGGGGHKKAAGAWHQGPLKKAIEDVIEEGSKQL